MDGKRILIIEDEKAISDIIKINLQKNGFEVEVAYDGNEGLEKVLAEYFDLIILDLMLPTVDGFDICRQAREKTSIPIIILTAKEEEVDKVLGLELGADDYIAKPFSMRELVARVKAHLRRSSIIAKHTVNPDEKNLGDGDIVVDNRRYEVRKKGEVIHLTLREFELFRFLSDNRGKVFSRVHLLSKVWGTDYSGDVRTIDVTIKRLREKIETDGAHPRYIKTKRGVGYYFEPKPN